MDKILLRESCQKTININGREIVKKHVATIHCVNRLSLLERKISNALLYSAYPNLKNSLIHEVSIERLKRLLNANTRNHKAIKQALKSLISTVIEWNILGDKIPNTELEGWNASTILSSVSVNKGIIKYQYSELIKDLIMNPQIYGKINLLIQSRFKSSYSLALYENCARYRGLKYTKAFEYDLFRKLMGVDHSKYQLFRDFNRRVLNAAVTEVNTSSDIFITPEVQRHGRKIVSIKFKLEERPMKKRIGEQLDNICFSNEEEQYITLCKELGITYLTLKKLVVDYGKIEVEDAIKYLKSCKNYKSHNINNIEAYLKTLIKNKFYKNINSFNRDPSNYVEKNLTEIQEKYRQYVAFETKLIFSNLDEKNKKEIEENYIKGNHQYFSGYAPNIYKFSGINNILLFEVGFSDYLMKNYYDLMSKVKSFDLFKKELIG